MPVPFSACGSNARLGLAVPVLPFSVTPLTFPDAGKTETHVSAVLLTVNPVQVTGPAVACTRIPLPLGFVIAPPQIRHPPAPLMYTDGRRLPAPPTNLTPRRKTTFT